MELTLTKIQRRLPAKAVSFFNNVAIAVELAVVLVPK